MARILMVMRPGKGGAFAHVTQLCGALSARDHQVAVCGPHADKAAGLAAEVLPVEIVRPLSPTGDARAIAGVMAAVRRFRPDLIHAHGSKGGVIARLSRVVRPRTPLVFTPHQYAFENYFDGGGRRVAYEAIERVLAPLATRVIGVCEAERRLAATIGPGRRTRLVYNGIEPLPRVPPDPRLAALRERGPTVVAVAELHPRKGIPTLLEAMPKVLGAHPSATAVIAGGGEERQRLEAMARDLGLGDSVRFLGHVDDVPAVLAGADVFVNPAWAEAFPYSVIEAMSVGVPIVATDVGGTGEAIRPAETGMLVPPREPEPLGRAITVLLEDRETACMYGERAAMLARERFTLERMVEGVLGVYAELGVLGDKENRVKSD